MGNSTFSDGGLNRGSGSPNSLDANHGDSEGGNIDSFELDTVEASRISPLYELNDIDDLVPYSPGGAVAEKDGGDTSSIETLKEEKELCKDVTDLAGTYSPFPLRDPPCTPVSLDSYSWSTVSSPAEQDCGDNRLLLSDKGGHMDTGSSLGLDCTKDLVGSGQYYGFCSLDFTDLDEWLHEEEQRGKIYIWR